MSFDPAAVTPTELPAVDAYSLRLVTTRKLYDKGTLVQHSPALAGLAGSTRVRVHPSDFDRLGIEVGSTVRAITARGSHEVEVVPDPTAMRGTAIVGFNLDGIDAAELIDASATVNDLRLEVT
jgi:anaerobic selenocysteine-containing dehydrogenase